MTFSKFLLGALAVVSAAVISALGYAACSTTIGPVGNTGTWTADASGEILTYSGNGLSYTKCQLGTSGATCATGSVQTFTWQGALQASVAARVGGFSDWRLPNLQEAVALIEPTCDLPALSPAFPLASAGQPWTSTTSGQLGNGGGAWYINTFGGTTSVSSKATARSVILVRGSSTPAGNFDSLPAAIVSLAPSVTSVAQNAPFDVVVSTPSPVSALTGVSLNILTQPAGPAGSLTGNVFCSIPSGSSTCTVTGLQMSGPAGLYTLSASTAGGPPGGVTVNASAPIDLLSGPTALLFAPLSATQFAPFNLFVSITQALASDVTFEVVRTGGPAGTLGGTATCVIPTGSTSCSLPSVTFSGYGPALVLTASVISGPSIPPADVGFDIDPQPVNITMGTPASQIVNVGFSTLFNIDVALPIPITMTSQLAPSHVTAGTFTPTSCVIPAGSQFCSALGNTFSNAGPVLIRPIIFLSADPILVQSTNTATINIVNQGGTLSAPATATQFTPFNVTLILAAGAAATTTFTLAQASGPAGTLGGGTTCTITVGNLSCTFTGVTFSGSGPALGLAAAATSGPATPVLGTSLDVTAVSYTISPIAPASVQAGVPFSVTLQSTQPVAVAVPLTIALASGPAGSLLVPSGCTIPVGATSCTISGVTLASTGAVQITPVASGAVSVALSFEIAGLNVAAAPARIAVAVPSMSVLALGLLAALVSLLGIVSARRQGRPKIQ